MKEQKTVRVELKKNKGSSGSFISFKVKKKRIGCEDDVIEE